MEKNEVLSLVMKRYNDTLHLFYNARDTYFEPNSFRANIQSCITQMRTITFILQKNKSKVKNFDDWYSKWQEKMRSNEIMKWIVESRNQIEKQGDLEKHSLIDTKVIISYINKENPINTISSDECLFLGLEEIRKKIPSSIWSQDIMKNGVLEIGRRWVANTFPKKELLSLLSYSFLFLLDMINDLASHENLELANAENLENIKRSLINEDFRYVRKKLNSLGDGGLNSKTVRIKRDDSDDFQKLLKSRYKNIKFSLKDEYSSFEEYCENWFSLSLQLLKNDGFLFPIGMMFKYKNKKIEDLRFFTPIFSDKQEKFLAMQKVADEIKVTQSTGFIFINEAYVHFPKQKQAEAACLMACNESGKVFSLMQNFVKQKQKVVLKGETIKSIKDQLYILNPILEVWGKGYK